MVTQTKRNGDINVDLSNLPDFQKNICLVITDLAGNRIAQTNPIFSACEAERIAEAGIEEYLQVQLVPVEGTRVPGMEWSKKEFRWVPASTPKTKRLRATA